MTGRDAWEMGEAVWTGDGDIGEGLSLWPTWLRGLRLPASRVSPALPPHNICAMSLSHVHDCVIVGAGISGLSAACYLHAHGDTDFIVLEARQRVGGRSYTVSTADNHAVDLGAAHVGPTQNRILRVLHDYSFRTTRVHTAGSTVTVLRSGRHVHAGSVPSLLSPLTLLDINHSFLVTEQQRRQLQLPSSSSLRQRLEADDHAAVGGGAL